MDFSLDQRALAAIAAAGPRVLFTICPQQTIVGPQPLIPGLAPARTGQAARPTLAQQKMLASMGDGRRLKTLRGRAPDKFMLEGRTDNPFPSSNEAANVRALRTGSTAWD